VIKVKVVLTLPTPPSANTYYRRSGHIVHLSHKGRDYKTKVAQLVKQQTSHHFGSARLKVSVLYTPETLRREDLDNRLKSLNDALSILFDDDSQIDSLSIDRLPKDKTRAGVTVSIEEIQK
jgi:crossover junction endodeoxyribonuclease RusA